MRYSENIESLFKDEIREKRKAGNGAFHKRGKGVKHGFNSALRTPYFFMTSKEKKNLNGKVEVSFLYDTILVKEEFFSKDIEMQKTMLTRWRELYDNKRIMQEMGITSNARFHKLLVDLEIPKKYKRISGPKKRKGKTAAEKKNHAFVAITEEKVSCSQGEEAEITGLAKFIPPHLLTNGLHLEFNGDYDSEQLNKILTKLQLVVDGEEGKFRVSILLTERT